MTRLNNRPLSRVIELELEREYQRTLTHAVRYDAGWDQAQEAFQRLQAFRQGLADMGVVTTFPENQELPRAA